jgi:hypothetical protein
MSGEVGDSEFEVPQGTVLPGRKDWPHPWAPPSVHDEDVLKRESAKGVRDEAKLTDAVFYERHPEWKGKLLPSRPSGPAIENLKAEWRFVRGVIVAPFTLTIGHPFPTQEDNYLPVNEWESMIGEAPPAPVFRFLFPPPAGCPALTEAQYRAILHQAVMEAIRLANNAASKLEAVGPETASLYRFFFCHEPSRPVPWAGNEASGSIVARRFRAVARELGGGRRIIFRCDPNCDANTRAFSLAEPNVISLCALFWTPPIQPGLPPEGFRGGVILHEMFHVLFTMRHIDQDPKEKRTNNAHCLRAFALRALGYGQDNLAIRGCTDDPC